MSNKDYTDYGGRKRKLERQSAIDEAKQKQRPPKKKVKNPQSMNHRLNEAHEMINELCRTLCAYVEMYEKEGPTAKDAHKWWMKWRHDSAKKLLENAREILKERQGQ